MSLYEKSPRWIEVDLSMYVAHWNNTNIANDDDLKTLQEILQGMVKRSEIQVGVLYDCLVQLGERFDKPMMRVFESPNSEKRMEWIQAKKHSRMLTNIIMNLRRESHDNGWVKYKFAILTSVPLKDAEWLIRSQLLSRVFELMSFHADNILAKKAAEEIVAGPLVHEREMYYMHMKGVRDSMERLIRGNDQYNNFQIKL